ncbi:zinc finger and SCAN domain-containing protein 12-like isoform X2 [Ruditapes philippinarum]|uniref:zinc finger and SCAN domain-containing protein 12-like isoform X2 n=1 Tax=Ruditapes philippinarum TaxID=129788 RepID=UPI00295C2A6A|nr:zinc finger and SCAN domain-containing protein 12-like isoform X2 [Ruditapes philippinarum]
MEDSDEFKWAVKVVIKRQMRDLMEQLRERGEEIAILTVNLDDNTCSHFGSPSGEWFVSEQKNLAQNFLKFCKVKEGSQNTDTHISTGTFSSPRSAVKQRTAQSAGAPTLTVTVPKQLAGDVTEEELASLVGRIVASQLAVQEKGDGSSSGTKFDLLVEAANNAKKNRGTSSVVSTPSSRSTRKRKMSQRYREGISSLKKGKKSEEEDTGSEYETGHDENVITNMLAQLSTTILKRVKVKTSEEVPVSIEKSVLASSDQLESLAVLLIQEIDEMAGGLLTKEKLVQVKVILDDDNKEHNITVELSTRNAENEKRKGEEMDDSDMEYLDLPEASDLKRRKIGDEQFNSVSYSERDDESDPDFDPGLEFEEIDTTMEALVEGSDEPRGRGRPKKGSQKKKKKSMMESIPMQCEECDTVLTGLSSLKAHVKRMHLKERDFLCHICSKAFFTVTHREDHIISVHTRRCKGCNSDVVESTPWDEGVTKKSLRVAECPCGNQVQYISKVGRAKVEDEEENGTVTTKQKKRKSLAECTPMTCEHCGLIVTGKSSLIAHVKRQHLKEFDHKCTICSKEFFTSTHLETHLLSVHTRKCKDCGDFVIEKEPWTENMDRTQERIVECKCGTQVSIFTKLGPKPGNGEEVPGRKKKQKAPSDTRYVCGTCGKIFLKKINAMTHKCVQKLEKEPVSDETEMKEHHKFTHEFDNENEDQSENIDDVAVSQFKVEADNFVLEEGSQVVMYEQAGDQSASGITSVQIMHDGKLVPAEQVVDEHGNVSFILKTE